MNKEIKKIKQAIRNRDRVTTKNLRRYLYWDNIISKYLWRTDSTGLHYKRYSYKELGLTFPQGI